jgi:two-component system, NtrC family, sensor kinase
MMNTTDFKLRERIKELNCLYSISKMAWAADNNLAALLTKTIEILPKAMQHPSLAEARIVVDGQSYESKQFPLCKYFIKTELTLNKKSYGELAVGYRSPLPKSKSKPQFLPEERNLVKAVGRELSLFIKRATVEAEKEKLQIQLQHVERLAFVGELSAGIAHELNEPLAGILGFAQLIKKTGHLTDQQTDDIERIIKASLYTREIIKKLMIFSRQMPRQISKINLNDVVNNILYFIDVRFQSRRVSVLRKLDESLADIEADEVQMSQVLVNLITNAVHAMPNGGKVTIATKNAGKEVSLTVKDTGHGMSRSVREKIFEPFFTTKPQGHGTGLGLSVVQGIIDSHAGKIYVNSTPGKGSKFEILLPKTQR